MPISDADHAARLAARVDIEWARPESAEMRPALHSLAPNQRHPRVPHDGQDETWPCLLSQRSQDVARTSALTNSNSSRCFPSEETSSGFWILDYIQTPEVFAFSCRARSFHSRLHCTHAVLLMAQQTLRKTDDNSGLCTIIGSAALPAQLAGGEAKLYADRWPRASPS